VLPGTIYNFSFAVKNPLLPIRSGPVLFSARWYLALVHVENMQRIMERWLLFMSLIGR